MAGFISLCTIFWPKVKVFTFCLTLSYAFPRDVMNIHKDWADFWQRQFWCHFLSYVVRFGNWNMPFGFGRASLKKPSQGQNDDFLRKSFWKMTPKLQSPELAILRSSVLFLSRCGWKVGIQKVKSKAKNRTQMRPNSWAFCQTTDQMQGGGVWINAWTCWWCRSRRLWCSCEQCQPRCLLKPWRTRWTSRWGQSCCGHYQWTSRHHCRQVKSPCTSSLLSPCERHACVWNGHL